MPKTNDNTGATAAGMTGIVEHGAPINDGRKFSELDPELNLDGTLIEGEHPDHPKTQEREYIPAPDAPRPIDLDPDETTDEEDESDGREPDGDISKPQPDATPATLNEKNEEGHLSGRDVAGKEDKSSLGISSKQSTEKTSTTSAKNTSNRR